MTAVISPAANPHLFGQEAAETAFERALATGRMPHAWLLRGVEGVGKATLAFRLARRLLADDPAAVGDPARPVFRMVAAGGHPDLRVLVREPPSGSKRLRKEITIDQVRLAEERLYTTAARGGRRVLIVDWVDELSRSAANALLKLLEEPPDGVVLLLVCQRSGQVPRTIVSRCAQLPLRPLPPEALAAALDHLAPDLDPRHREIAMALAGGSPGRALRLATGDWPQTYAAMVQGLAEAAGDAGARIPKALDLAKRGEAMGFSPASDLLRQILRRTARAAAGRPASIDLFPGEAQALRTLAAGRPLDHWVGLWDKLAGLAGGVEALNLDPFQALLQIVYEISGGELDARLA